MKTVLRFDPFAEMRQLQSMFDHVIGETSPGTRALPVDVVEEKDALILRSSVPGVHPDHLTIEIEGRVLTLRAELPDFAEAEDAKIYRREIATGKFTRSIRLPEGLNLEGTEATHEHGMLTVRVPRVVPEVPPVKSIPIRQP